MTQVCCSSPFLEGMVQRVSAERCLSADAARELVKEVAKDVLVANRNGHSPEWQLLVGVAAKLKRADGPLN